MGCTGVRRSKRAHRLLEDFALVGAGLHNDECDPELALRGYTPEEIAAAATHDRGLWTYLATRAAGKPQVAAPGQEPTPAPRVVSRATVRPAEPAKALAKPARTRRGGVPV